MKSPACPYETAIARAARAGLWKDALRAHIIHCTSCRETATVAAFLNSAAATTPQVAHLPDAPLLWLRRNLMKTEAVVERSLLPIRAAEALVWSALLTAVIGLPIWTGSSWLSELKSWSDTVWNSLSTATLPAFGGLTPGVGMAALTILFVAAVLAAEPDLADD